MTIDQWFPSVEFPVSKEVFDRLPRHAAYCYDYVRGDALLTPELRQYHCVLSLEPREPASIIDADLAQVRVRRAREADWSELEPIFARAFRQSTPLGQVTEDAAAGAANEALHRTRTAESGTIVREACFVARGALPSQTDSVLGGLLVSLQPAGDLERFDDPAWREPPPPAAVAERWGRPHLTWVFVDPWIARHGVASILLDHAVNALDQLGYRELASTFFLGNEAATLWHWRNGFRLCSYVLTPRIMDRRIAVERGHQRVESSIH